MAIVKRMMRVGRVLLGRMDGNIFCLFLAGDMPCNTIVLHMY